MGATDFIDGEVNTLGKRLLLAYLVKNKSKELETILQSDNDVKRHVVHIHSQELIDVSVSLFVKLMSDPDKWMVILDRLLLKALDLVYKEGASKVGAVSVRTKKEKVQLRLGSLPNDPWFQKTAVPRVEQVGQMVQLVATVTKTTQRDLFVWRKDVRCVKCRFTFPMTADLTQFNTVPLSGVLCPNPERCNGTLFTDFTKLTEDTENENTKDYQEIKIQEQSCNLVPGHKPGSLWVSLEDDLVEIVKPGDHVEIIGVVKQRWNPLGNQLEEKNVVELVLQAHNLTVQNSETCNIVDAEEAEEEFSDYWSRPENLDVLGRNKLVASFCPELVGLYIAKLAVAMVLAGGVEKKKSDGTRQRGEPHLLLAGQPGTGKTQLLKFVSKVEPRCVWVTGTTTSTAGLTVSAVNEGGQFHLEAGALVLADGGVCCIDEFDKISEADRACLHEAMEQQTISIAKAGISCSMPTRCSVFATSNLSNDFDPAASMTDNTGLASPLLSRFDAVLVLVDSRNPDYDWQLGGQILSGSPEEKSKPAADSYWSLTRLQAYFSHVKMLRPDLGSGAYQVLERYYKYKRNSDMADAARTTIRLLQSSIRLSQGHAKLMRRTEVSTQDAVMAVVVLEASNEATATLIQSCNLVHSDLPPDPVAEYKVQARQVLVGLGLTELWEEELARLEALQARQSSSDQRSLASQARPAADFSQLVQSIKRNRAVTTTLPPPPPPHRARKKRKRPTGAKKIKANGKKNKRDEEDEVIEEVHEEDSEEDSEEDNSKESNKNDVKVEKETESNDEAEEGDLSPPIHQSTQKSSQSPIQNVPVMSQKNHEDVSLILEEPNDEDNETIETAEKIKSLSSKTQKKLEKFRRIDREPEHQGISKKQSESKSTLAKLLDLAGKLGRSSQQEEDQKCKVKDDKFPWEENGDFDFEF